VFRVGGLGCAVFMGVRGTVWSSVSGLGFRISVIGFRVSGVLLFAVGCVGSGVWDLGPRI